MGIDEEIPLWDLNCYNISTNLSLRIKNISTDLSLGIKRMKYIPLHTGTRKQQNY